MTSALWPWQRRPAFLVWDRRCNHGDSPCERELNGIRKGERVVVVDCPRVQGTVVHCCDASVVVRWDDGKTGDLEWNDAVMCNAYRLQVVRHA